MAYKARTHSGTASRVSSSQLCFLAILPMALQAQAKMTLSTSTIPPYSSYTRFLPSGITWQTGRIVSGHSCERGAHGRAPLPECAQYPARVHLGRGHQLLECHKGV